MTNPKRGIVYCATCGEIVTDPYGRALTHEGACRETYQRISSRDSKRRYRLRNKTKKPINHDKPKPRKYTHCLVCGWKIKDRAHNAKTCSAKCGLIRRKQTGGNGLRPRESKMHKSAVVNTWNSLHANRFYQRPESLRRIRTNVSGVIAELLSCPTSVNPKHIRLHRCGAGCWKIRIKGKPVTAQMRDEWSHNHESVDYRILNASVAGVE